MQRFSFNHIIPGVLLWTFAAFPSTLSAQMADKPGFIENLGQWTEKFYYKAELGGSGAIFISRTDSHQPDFSGRRTAAA